MRNGLLHAAERYSDRAQCLRKWDPHGLKAWNPYNLPWENFRDLGETCGAGRHDLWPCLCVPNTEVHPWGIEGSASNPGSPAQGRIIRASARGWVRCTAVVHGGGWGWTGQVHCAPQHQVTHVTHRVQHLTGDQRGYRFKQIQKWGSKSHQAIIPNRCAPAAFPTWGPPVGMKI